MNDAIATLVRRHDPDRFLTALFAPPEHRNALLTLYAFDHELARAREVTSDPHLGLIRLQWWREIVEGARRRHEIATPLGVLLDSRLAPEALLPIIDAYEIEAEPCIETLAGWRDWLLAGAGGVAVAAARLLGVPNPEGLRGCGAAHGAARVIRWQRTLASRGRCLLPADLLDGAGISMHDAIAAPRSPEVDSVLRRLVTEGQRFLDQTDRGPIPRAWIAAALPTVLASRDLRRGLDSHPGPRGLADRLAVIWAGLTGRL